MQLCVHSFSLRNTKENAQIKCADVLMITSVVPGADKLVLSLSGFV